MKNSSLTVGILATSYSCRQAGTFENYAGFPGSWVAASALGYWSLSNLRIHQNKRIIHKMGQVVANVLQCDRFPKSALKPNAVPEVTEERSQNACYLCLACPLKTLNSLNIAIIYKIVTTRWIYINMDKNEIEIWNL